MHRFPHSCPSSCTLSTRSKWIILRESQSSLLCMNFELWYSQVLRGLFTWYLSSFVSWSVHSLLPALSSIAQSPRGAGEKNLRPGKGAHPNRDERLLFYFVTRSSANSLQEVNEPYHLTKLSLGESGSWSGVATLPIMFPCSRVCVCMCVCRWCQNGHDRENVPRNLCRGYFQDVVGLILWGRLYHPTCYSSTVQSVNPCWDGSFLTPCVELITYSAPMTFFPRDLECFKTRLFCPT